MKSEEPASGIRLILFAFLLSPRIIRTVFKVQRVRPQEPQRIANGGGEHLLAQSKLADSSSRLVVHDLARRNGNVEFARDIRSGLSANPKHLFPKYLYDEVGSRLFEAICQVDEYYLTRAEREILTTHADEIAATVPNCATLIELGSGNAQKTRKIIEALLRRRNDLLFVPIDISVTALEESSHSLLKSYPNLRIEAYAADYFEGLAALPAFGPQPVLALFLGSNIGNFEPQEAVVFLRAIRAVLRKQDALLLGADLKKDRATLEAAYNDSLGVTRTFIVNELARINRELDADFDLWAFGLRSIYNEAEGRVEVYLESLRPQTVIIRGPDMSIELDAGERIQIEYAYKYDRDNLALLGKQSGFKLERTWLDEEKRFSSNLFRADS